jgi:prevent-host-death family protein
MKEIGSYEAKTHLTKLLEKVAHGERICITRRGKPVAMLVPMRGGKRDRRAVAQAIRDQRKGVKLGGLSLRKMIDEGRRY